MLEGTNLVRENQRLVDEVTRLSSMNDRQRETLKDADAKLADAEQRLNVLDRRYTTLQEELRLSREQYQELIDSSKTALEYEQRQVTELTEAVKRRDAAINRARDEAAHFRAQAPTEYLVMLPNGRWEICHLVYDEQARYCAAWANRSGSICLSAADEPQVERLP